MGKTYRKERRWDDENSRKAELDRKIKNKRKIKNESRNIDDRAIESNYGTASADI